MDSDHKKIYNKAINLLSRREYAYQELLARLLCLGDKEQVTPILDHLVAAGLLSDERYIECYIDSKRNKYGLQKIQYQLNLKTQNPELVQMVMSRMCASDGQKKLAYALLVKKFGEDRSCGGRSKEDSYLRSKMMRFLYSRGFDMEIIHELVK